MLAGQIPIGMGLPMSKNPKDDEPGLKDSSAGKSGEPAVEGIAPRLEIQEPHAEGDPKSATEVPPEGNEGDASPHRQAVPDGDEETAVKAAGFAQIQTNRQAHLQRAILNAQALMAFSAETDVELPDDVVEKITNAQRTYGKQTWSPQIETSFWLAFRELSSCVKPVTSSSLDWHARRGKVTAILFILLGICSLIALIFGQVFWVYINNTSTQIENSIQALNQKSAEFVELEGTMRLLKDRLEADSPVDDGTEDRQQLGQRLNELSGKIGTVESETKQIKRLLAAQYIILADWVPELPGDPKPSDPSWFDSEEEADSKRAALRVWYDQQNTEREFEKEYLLAQAASILALMSTYVLPLLYGALGTFAYILRSVARGIRERILNESSILNFWVRVPLGMLSGVAVGWFLSTDNLPTGWASVQPLALAFIAGYSVELIFTAMDRLVGAFTSSSQPRSA